MHCGQLMVRLTMRTTLTLDDDLAEALNRAARLTGRSFKAVVHETLRRGLALTCPPAEELDWHLAIAERGLGPDDLAALKRQAEREGISKNRLVLRRLVDKPQPESSGAPSELEALSGTWSQEEADHFQMAIAPLERVEPEHWG
jgi:Arc/MetJ family transcription regulator